MTALETMFADLRQQGRAALVGYLPAGYPTVQGSNDLLTAMIDGGCDLVEVGLPFSDPVLDGPVIQHAAQTALAAGFPDAGPVRCRRIGHRGGRPGGGHDVLQPGAGLRRRQLRP